MGQNNNGRRSILCVDGDAEVRALLTELLNDYEIIFARDAGEAVRSVNRRAFSAYLLEYLLPDWSGIALCRHIRVTDPHAPIIFCTGPSKDAQKATAMQAGATAYLCKPVAPRLLRSKLGAFLTLAELESLHARIAEERAIQEELARRAADVYARVDAAQAVMASSVERMAKVRAYRAFIAARGTRANFDSWWPSVFESVCAERGLV